MNFHILFGLLFGLAFSRSFLLSGSGERRGIENVVCFGRGRVWGLGIYLSNKLIIVRKFSLTLNTYIHTLNYFA